MENILTQWLFGSSCIDRVKNLHYQTMFTLRHYYLQKKFLISTLGTFFFSVLLFTGFFFSVSLCTLTIRFALEMHFAWGGQKACCVYPEMHFSCCGLAWARVLPK
jgi:hypothetical protein